MTAELRDSLAQVQELLGCPWCGEAPQVSERCYQGSYPIWTIQCVTRECPAQRVMVEDNTKSEAITAWNTRHGAGDAEAWRSIDSAPRDGTRIILGRPDLDGDGGISVAGYWLEELEDGVDYMGNDGGFTDVDFQVFQPGRSFGAESHRYAGNQPTHWRPLPAPPSEDAAKAGERWATCES